MTFQGQLYICVHKNATHPSEQKKVSKYKDKTQSYVDKHLNDFLSIILFRIILTLNILIRSVN